jgi:hypothetical protein
MLDAVMAEMTADQTRGAAAEPSALSIEPDAAGTALGEVSALLAERDERTAELEAAIRELQAAGAGAGGTGGTAPAADPALLASLAQIEARLEEQEQSLRHVLAMLIEWLEGDASRKAA